MKALASQGMSNSIVFRSSAPLMDTEGNEVAWDYVGVIGSHYKDKSGDLIIGITNGDAITVCAHPSDK